MFVWTLILLDLLSCFFLSSSFGFVKKKKKTCRNAGAGQPVGSSLSLLSIASEESSSFFFPDSPFDSI